MNLEALITKLKRIGFKEEYLPTVILNGERIPGVKIYHELKADLQFATKLLSAEPEPVHSASLADNTSGKLNVSEPQIEGAHLQQKISGSGLNGPQQQLLPAGRGGGASITPHQFGLTPFQSMCKAY